MRITSKDLQQAHLGGQRRLTPFKLGTCGNLQWPPASSLNHRLHRDCSTLHSRSTDQCCLAVRADGLVQAGPSDAPPSYEDIDRQPLNKLILQLFRSKMVQAIGEDSELEGYDAIIDLTRKLNSKYLSASETQKATQRILISLFPRWLLPAFTAMFAKPLPGLSCRLNAWVTALTCQWLMGPSTVNDTELDDGNVGQGYGVLVERCRYLEQSGCASICINSCKVPTQKFFAEEMGLPLTMTPNYEDFSCQFAFGKTPLPVDQDDAFRTPCFMQCPTKRQHRQCRGIEVKY